MENKENIYSREFTPVPICNVGISGKITWANERIKDVFLYGDIVEADIFALTGIYYNEFVSRHNREEKIEIKISEKTFKILVEKIDEEEIRLFFIEKTEEVITKEELQRKQGCIALIHVDNYEDIVGNSNSSGDVKNEIESKIRDYGKKLKAVVGRHKSNLYFFMLERQYIEEEINEEFPILEEIKSINTDEDFPVTLSVGVGIGELDLTEAETFADEALDLALGRGGDQAVIKQGEVIQYFGGQSESVGNRNKGKSRIIAAALKALVDSSRNVIIMGHKYPDMDSFGAALGVHRIVRPIKKETYILLDNPGKSLSMLYDKAKSLDEYKFINKEKALSVIKKNTLLIIVDVNRPSMTECPELLEKVGRIVVIDHHRKGEQSILKPTIAFTEPAASSASELVVEMLEYSGDNISKLEAEALLAGIFMDTNRFSVKTGTRTLSAAGWLKGKGADPTVVKRYFQISYEMFKSKAMAIASATVTEEGLATAVCEGFNRDAQVINSQVADELLTIEGVKASFVAGKDEKGETMVSGRSLGDINIQTIMEAFDGGGHYTTAGTQTDKAPFQIIEEILEYIRKHEILK